MKAFVAVAFKALFTGATLLVERLPYILKSNTLYFESAASSEIIKELLKVSPGPLTKVRFKS